MIYNVIRYDCATAKTTTLAERYPFGLAMLECRLSAEKCMADVKGSIVENPNGHGYVICSPAYQTLFTIHESPAS